MRQYDNNMMMREKKNRWSEERHDFMKTDQTHFNSDEKILQPNLKNSPEVRRLQEAQVVPFYLGIPEREKFMTQSLLDASRSLQLSSSH